MDIEDMYGYPYLLPNILIWGSFEKRQLCFGWFHCIYDALTKRYIKSSTFGCLDIKLDWIYSNSYVLFIDDICYHTLLYKQNKIAHISWTIALASMAFILNRIQSILIGEDNAKNQKVVLSIIIIQFY